MSSAKISLPGVARLSQLRGVPVRLPKQLWFPDPERYADDRGLVAVGGDLSVPRLVLACRSGLFPWTADPVTWWSPDPRGVLELDQLHISRSLARTLRKAPYEVTCDRNFPAVIRNCAGQKRGERTWITAEFISAYCALHEAGHAHSVECWRDGRLVGGIYGVSVGALFAGESMFHLEDDASKVALVHLVHRLRERGYRLLDIQMVTPVTVQMGASEISRSQYLRRLGEAVKLEVTFSDD